MIIGFRARPNNSRYFTCLIAVCVFICYAAIQVASQLSGAPKASLTPPAKSMIQTAAPISVHVIDGDTIGLNDGRPNVRLASTLPRQEAGRDARQNARRAKPPGGAFAN